MSHFSVCVAIPAERLEDSTFSPWDVEDILDEILAPFDENTTSEAFLEFVDRTVQVKAEYDKDLTTAVKFPDGTIRTPSDPEFAERYTVQDGVIQEKINGDFLKLQQPEECLPFSLVQNYPVKEVLTFEEFCQKHFGYEQHDGLWGYWHNPNAQWDWFSIGGRFSDAFLVKDSNNPHRCMYADGGRKKSIAWEEMRKQAEDDAKAEYRKYKEAFEKKDVSDMGSLVGLKDDGIYGWGNVLFKEGETMEAFLTRNGLAPGDLYSVECYAFVDLHGEWHSLGNMGWFGISSNDKEERSWHEEIQNFLREVGEEDYLVMVDCHI